MHITVANLRDLISPTSMMYHELLLLGLEVVCHTFSSGYVDTSFFPSILTGGCNEVKNRFSPPNDDSITGPSLNKEKIAIILHINDNHWIALCHQKVGNTRYFFYADDLNNHQTKHQVKHILYSSTKTSNEFCHPLAIWVNCISHTYRPHFNECGP
jgi:hypothetical protein